MTSRGRALLGFSVAALLLLVRGPLHLATHALPVSNDDAIPLLIARHILGGELTTILWNQPYNGTLDAYLLAPGLLVASAHAVFRLYEAACGLLLVGIVGWLARPLGHRSHSQLPRPAPGGGAGLVRSRSPERPVAATGDGCGPGCGIRPRRMGLGPRPARARRRRGGSRSGGTAAAARRSRRPCRRLRARREPAARRADGGCLRLQPRHRPAPALAVGGRPHGARESRRGTLRVAGPAGRGRAGAGDTAPRRRDRPRAGPGCAAGRGLLLAAVVAARGLGGGPRVRVRVQPPHGARRGPLPLRPGGSRARSGRRGLRRALGAPPRRGRPGRRGRDSVVPRARDPREDLARSDARGERLAGASPGAGAVDAGADPKRVQQLTDRRQESLAC